MIGVADATVAITSANYTTANGWAYYGFNGNKYTANVATAYGSTYAANDVIGVALDMDAGTIAFYKNNVSQGVAYSTLSGKTISPLIDNGGASQTASINFGQRPFSYTPPTGFNRLNTANLPTPTIANGATQMAATTYTGTGATQSVTNTVNGISMQPDFVWVKSRSNATNHTLFDSVRGINSSSPGLFSNLTDAEGSSVNCVSATLSNGFTISGSSGSLNLNTYTYVGWQWKASNAAAVTNTAGSISSQVSANTTAGFSIVTYTGNGSNPATVGHGVGTAPKFIILKRRNSAVNWFVYANAVGNGAIEGLNTTGAYSGANTTFNLTAPTSTVFSLGNADGNASGGTYVAYCFAPIAGYSAFGSYIGNGSTDGPFVYLGFRPRYLMIRRTSAIGTWYIMDSSRLGFNSNNNVLYANLTNAEASFSWDLLSNGFKARDNGVDTNGSGSTFIYMAFAENPFKLALAR
jgi:hypothetical protein